MPSWDSQVCQLWRTSRGTGGCLCCQEGGQGEAKGWRSPPHKRREKGVAKAPEEPEERATAAQGGEKGEAEVTVPEEEGAAQAAMEMEE